MPLSGDALVATWVRYVFHAMLSCVILHPCCCAVSVRPYIQRWENYRGNSAKVGDKGCRSEARNGDIELEKLRNNPGLGKVEGLLTRYLALLGTECDAMR